MYPYETVTYKKMDIRIYADDNEMSPRDWDNRGIMACCHKRYSLGDWQIKSEDFNSWSEIKSYLIKEKKARCVMPLYLYDHSGITISTQPFSCRWDSGQVGYIYTTSELLIKMCGKNIRSQSKLKEILLSEVKTYDAYLRGDVYGFEIIDEDGTMQDSCYGYFGRDFEKSGLLIDARASIDYLRKNEKLEQLELALKE